MTTENTTATDDPTTMAVDATGPGARAMRLSQADEPASTPAIVCRFHAEPGLHQLSVIVDASEYDWEQTYVNLHEFHNKGQRTGPWDFELHTNRPLIPAYWVHLDGRRLGMWFFQRVSLEDIAHKRFRGNTAFHVTESGEHELKLVPYQPMAVRWISAKLEVDPEDRLEPVPASLKEAPGNVPSSQWTDPDYWRQQQRKLETTHAAHRQPLREAAEFALTREHPGHDQRVNPALDIPLLVAGERLGLIEGGIARAIELIDESVARPHWGKSNEDGYGHNGDMGAALLMRSLAWATHIISARELGDARREQLLGKLAYQGDRFLEQALLTRDYWGGSLRQDHGWRSIWNFATAALLLHGVVPEAKTWLQYALPRMRRSLKAISRDGMIPPSSHGSLYLYLDEMAVFRQTLLALSDIDIYQEQLDALRNIVRFVCSVLHEPSGALLCGDDKPSSLNGGAAFFADMARLDRDPHAAWLLHRLLTAAPKDKATRTFGMHHSRFWSYFAYDPEVAPEPPELPRRRLTHLPDDARVHFHDSDQDVTLFLRCGPQNGYHAYRHAPGPCDRTEGAPIAGHFNLYLGRTPMLATPVPGYRLKSLLGTVMLVDGHGQIGDGDYPMGIPSWEHPGYRILFARMDEATQRAWIRLELKAAYPESLGLAHYTRDLIIEPKRRLICRDHVTLDQPRTLTWLFQTDRERGLRLEDNGRAVIGEPPALSIQPTDDAPSLEYRIEETDVVHNYASSFHSYDHVSYQTQVPLSNCCIDFQVCW